MNLQAVRAEFPILCAGSVGRPLAYLDNAATSQKPRRVLTALTEYYSVHNANVHRGIHGLGNAATEILESSREAAARFINARDAGEIVFTSGATDALNTIAFSLGDKGLIGPGDEVLTTAMEHHANFLPWLMLCKRTGASLKVAPLDPQGHIREEDFSRLLTPRVRLAAMAHMSNVTGTVNPLGRLLPMARAVGAVTVVDGAQGIAHQRVDVRGMDCDFYCFSGHKLYAPMGVGVLYGKKEMLSRICPFRYGGSMVRQVTSQDAAFAEPPYGLEAGTPDVGGIYGLAEAMRYLDSLDRDDVFRHEAALYQYCRRALKADDRIRVLGDGVEQSGMVSFTVKDAHSYDLAFFLDGLGVATRSGSHCAQVFHQQMALSDTVRASFALYNTTEEIDRLADGVSRFLSLQGRGR